MLVHQYGMMTGGTWEGYEWCAFSVRTIYNLVALLLETPPRYDQGWHRVADPFRHLSDGIASLGNPIGSPVDKVLVGVFRAKSLLGSLDDLLREPETTTMERLRVGGGGGCVS